MVLVNEKDRLIEYWLTNDEKADAALRASLQPEFRRWKAQKYLPVVYESGGGDLREGVRALLRKRVRDAAQCESVKGQPNRTARGV